MSNRIDKCKIQAEVFIKTEDKDEFTKEFNNLLDKYANKFGLLYQNIECVHLKTDMLGFSVGDIYYYKKGDFYWIIHDIDSTIIHGVKIQVDELEEFKKNALIETISPWSLRFWNAAYDPEKKAITHFWGYDSGPVKMKKSDLTFSGKLEGIAIINIKQSFQ